MKSYKTEIVNAIVARAESDRIVSLREVAGELGHRHISTEACRDIMAAVLKALPGYKAVKFVTDTQMKNPSTASLWTTLCFIDKAVEFELGEEVII